MSALRSPALKRDLGLVGWQIRYEQRSYWRNRGRGIFTFAFPLMFLVIFGALDKGQTLSTRGGIPYDDERAVADGGSSGRLRSGRRRRTARRLRADQP